MADDLERTTEAKIARLRERVKRLKEDGGAVNCIGVLLGILDLLEDEL